MNEMYSASLNIHSLLVFAIFALYALRIVFIFSQKDFKKMQRYSTLFVHPLNGIFLGLIIFTGIVMMASKHLEFTLENILMILLALFYLFLELHLAKSLRFIRSQEALVLFKRHSLKTILLQMITLTLLSLWMWQ